ncbi:MAG: nicotinate-nucleotide adenylyltransferase [Oscillospiraceae bacterium]|jgi:nicotinate-nucleotide adenylyltransferase|nr:nicotinate-nucleotide adenylyltransferase [Oscillospiraceae bacterium]
MREVIGILGGTFNPIHYGHLAMAEAAQAALHLTQTILMPTGDPPHKHKELAKKRRRLAMVKLAAEGRFAVSDLEVERPGKTYTIDTLTALRAQYPDADLWMIIGADTLHEIAKWRDAPRVFTLCRFAVFARGDLTLPDVPGAEVMRIDTPVPGISATEIRARVHRGASLSGLTPPAVIRYIGQHRLYDPPVRLNDKAMRARLKKDLSEARYRHVMGVEAAIRALARRWDYDEKRAALAALLHDCAKDLSLEAMLRLVDDNGEPTDPQRRSLRELLHAPAGAAMARAVYGVTDPDVLTAIATHNTGRPDAGMLDKLLWLADMTESGRKDRPWMAALRKTAMEDLNQAAYLTMRQKIAFIEARGKTVHPDGAAAYAALSRQQKEENG